MSRKITMTPEPKCEYCALGKPSADGSNILCPKKGVLDKDYSCKKFRYDPLKRIPQAASPALQKFTPEDFSL